MSNDIHPTAIIEKGAQLGEGVSVGAYSIVGPDVVLGDNTIVESHVVINGHTTLGENNHVFPYAAIGGAPQSITYKGEPTQVVIGDNNIFRENVTVNRGTTSDEGITSIGNDNFFMAYTHIAHDCRLESNIVFANSASLAGHCQVGNYVVLAGYTLVHQFCRVGDHCFTGVNSVCIQDVPPFTLVAGNRAITHGINVRGLRRRGFSSDDILELKRAYKIVYRSGLTMTQALETIEGKEWQSEHVKSLVSFIRGSKRGVIR